MKFYEYISNSLKVKLVDTILSRTCYIIQRDVTQKVSIQELQFLCSACQLMLVNICMKFHEDILNGFKLTEWTWFCHRTAKYTLQRDVTKKMHTQELWFLHSVCYLLVLIFVWSFMKIPWKVLMLQSGHNFVLETATYKLQRGITQKV